MPPSYPTSSRTYAPQASAVRAIGFFIFFSRWLQAPLYLGLIVAQLIYVVVFIIELVHVSERVIHDPMHIDEAQVMLAVLGLIDVVMIANLLIMVIIGGYETFVSRIAIDGHPDQPEWLSHVNANVLKVKLAMAIIGISSIHLLKTFIEVGDLGAPTSEGESITGQTYTGEGVFWQVIIHTVFILSALTLAIIDRMSLRAVHPRNDGADHSQDGPHQAPPAHESGSPVRGYLIDGRFVPESALADAPLVR